MKIGSSSPSEVVKAPAQQIALNAEGAAPEWIELIPAGFDVRGRDGRTWINPDPAGVVAATMIRLPLPLDWEHATEVRAPKGEDAPAAGWVEETQVREDGSIWGRMDWTLRGRSMVEAKEYRFVSPVFAFDKLTGAIRRLISVGLTNTPNLLLTALNREALEQLDLDPSISGGPNREPPETPLSIATRLAAALGLAATASEDDIVTAATQAHAANSTRNVDLTSYAPRADLEAAVNRAMTAEAALTAVKAKDHETAIETAISAAQDAGKIIPASVDQYRAMCRAEGGLEMFNALVPTMPVIAGAAESRAVNKVEMSAGSGLTDEERAVCRALGQDEATFKSAKQES